MIPLSDGTMSLYADDMVLYRPIYIPVDYHHLQGDVNNLRAWTDGNTWNLTQVHDHIQKETAYYT